MAVNLELNKFSGPLDLLLSLIKDNKFNISELNLSQVTEQYLDYLDKLEKNKEEELSDFLVVGTRLLFLKSRMLLPQFDVEEEDDHSLTEQLKLYKVFVDASKIVSKLWLNKKRSVFRVEPLRKSAEFVPPLNLSQDNLQKNMLQLINRLRPLKPLPQTRIDKAVSLKERLDKIRRIVNKKSKVEFFELIDNSKNKTEVIVSFLALLELMKQKTVELKQDNSFSDILIEKA
jgi:segregation and condensation protein A